MNEMKTPKANALTGAPLQSRGRGRRRWRCSDTGVGGGLVVCKAVPGRPGTCLAVAALLGLVVLRGCDGRCEHVEAASERW